VHRINHEALFHHDLFPAGCLMGHLCIRCALMSRLVVVARRGNCFS
jgi:hypothetical protein